MKTTIIYNFNPTYVTITNVTYEAIGLLVTKDNRKCLFINHSYYPLVEVTHTDNNEIIVDETRLLPMTQIDIDDSVESIDEIKEKIKDYIDEVNASISVSKEFDDNLQIKEVILFIKEKVIEELEEI